MKISPDMTIDFSFIFSFIATLGVIFSIYRSSKTSSRDETEGVLKANLKLDSLCNATDEIRMDIKGLTSKIEDLSKTQTKHDTIIEEMRKDIEETKIRVSNLEKEH